MNSPIDEALVMHEVLRSLKFSADDIYVGLFKEGIFVVLRTQDKNFTISCGPRDPSLDDEQMQQVWEAAVHKWNGTCDSPLNDSDKQSIMDESRFFAPGKAQALAALILSIKGVGIDIPEKDSHLKLVSN